MLDGLLIVSLIGTVLQGIKDAFEPTIPAENWANKGRHRYDANQIHDYHCQRRHDTAKGN